MYRWGYGSLLTGRFSFRTMRCCFGRKGFAWRSSVTMAKFSYGRSSFVATWASRLRSKAVSVQSTGSLSTPAIPSPMESTCVSLLVNRWRDYQRRKAGAQMKSTFTRPKTACLEGGRIRTAGQFGQRLKCAFECTASDGPSECAFRCQRMPSPDEDCRTIGRGALSRRGEGSLLP